MGLAEARALGMASLPIVTVPHPVGGLPPAQVEKKADQALEDVVRALLGGGGKVSDETEGGRPRKQTFKAKSLFASPSGTEGDEQVLVSDNPDSIFQLFQARGWIDGLPFIPPKGERVAKMLAYTDRNPKEVLAVLPPRWGEATVEKIAINAVMAGCLPQYFPVVLAAVSAMADKAFNLYAVQATTHPCTPLILVNGPLAKELNINSRYNALGQGWRSNATIGRAIRLTLLNIGGGEPGVLDRATLGQPGKYSYCLAENEAENPWTPLHVERGFPREDSIVTLFGAEAPHNINDHRSNSGRDILKTMIHTMAVPGCNNALVGGEVLLLLGPEHAATIAGDGFSKEDVKKFLFEKARVPLDWFPESALKWIRTMRPHLQDLFEKGAGLPLVDRWQDVQVAVAGGAGKHSAFIPTFGTTKSITQCIAF
ncbi:MAG TPA: UGSC family (seleno)protein, partial [Thermodesulfobacteriota bacterium]|nr:UGSC family (seleno)protein [Thermodesulfobacteriota bacterium]